MAQPPSLSKPVERLDEVTEERVAPLLSVGDDVEPRRLLEANGLVHGLILDPLELGRTEPTGLDARSRLGERGRAQQTSDHIASDGHRRQCA